MKLQKNWKKNCKTTYFSIVAVFLFVCFNALCLMSCQQKSAPEDLDSAIAKILNCGWDLSYTDNSSDLDELLENFNFTCEGKLTAYLVAKDEEEETVLEVFFFELEADAKEAEKIVSAQISNSNRYGRSGCQIWYGTESAVALYLKKSSS